MPTRSRSNSTRSIQRKPQQNGKKSELKAAIIKARFGKAPKPKDQSETAAERSKTSEKKRDYWTKRNQMSKKRAEKKFTKKVDKKDAEDNDDDDDEFETVAVSESEGDSTDQDQNDSDSSLDMDDEQSEDQSASENDQVSGDDDDQSDEQSDEDESDDEKRVIDASLKAANRKGKKSGGFQSMGECLLQNNS
jgi:hypothetical protein